MSLMIIFIALVLTATLIFLNHPLTIGVNLLLQTILVTLMTGLLTKNFWFSYMMFLIMIGGMLILFIYMTSVASNEKFKFSPKLFLMFMLIPLILLLTLKFDNFFFDYLNNNLMNQIESYQFIFSLTKFINSSLNLIFFMIIIYLLITLIMVVKITDIQSGPLRQMN